MSKEILEQELKDYKFNPAKSSDWLWFMEKTILFDKEHRIPKGWHWYMGFCYLKEQEKIATFSTKKTAKTIPDDHWLKIKDKISSDDKTPISLKPRGDYKTMEKWATNIQAPNKIAKINFSKPFKKAIDFSNFIFPIDVSFENIKFSGKADFRDTLFFKDARFNDAKFLKDVRFDDAIFLETADFKNAIFHEETSNSKETAKFRNTIFEKIANFKNATFWGYANFKGAELKGRAFFQDAIFKHHAPRFYGAKFNNEITWAGIQLPDFSIADVDKNYKDNTADDGETCDEKTETNRRRRIEENQNSYENTAILLEGTKKYHDQHFFFREEMRCRRELEGNIFIRWAFGLYERVADYGYGIERALKIWLWNIVVGFVLIAIIAYYQGLEIGQGTFCSISTSFANANPFVFFGFKEGALMDCYECLHDLSPLLFGTIRGLQTLIGIPILFLLLTTLRVRFRLK
ncbi:MAG: pentapeptide repeat-containing protein [Candidatus Halichondribacter symbioticus]